MKRLPFVVFCSVLAASAVFAAPPIEISSGPALGRLRELVKKTDINLLYSASVVAGVTTNATSGTDDPYKALTEMLAGKDVKITVVQAGKGRAYTIKPAVVKAKPAALSLRSTAETEIIVTGTHIRGSEGPVGSQLLSIEREELEASSPGRTIADVLMNETLVHGGGPSDDTREGGQDAPSNSSKGFGVNLRGLGASSTLVLMNGERLAPSGSLSSFVDVSTIPLAAIERMEILADSGSALYGSDAVAGVVNFVLDRDFTGAETSASYGTGTDGTLREELVSQKFGKDWGAVNGMIVAEYYTRAALDSADRALAGSDLTAFGGDDFSSALSNPGNISTVDGVFGIPRGQDGKSLQLSDLLPGTPNLQGQLAFADLLAAQRRLSVYGSLKFDLRPDMRLSLDSLVSERHARAASGSFSTNFEVPDTNPFMQSLTASGLASPPEWPARVAYDFRDDIGVRTLLADVQVATANARLDFKVGSSWTLGASANYAGERQRQHLDNQVNLKRLADALADPDSATAFNPFGEGSNTDASTLDGLRAESHMRLKSELRSFGAFATGPLFSIGDRESKLAVGLSRREQTFDTALANGVLDVNTHDVVTRDVDAAYGELRLPVLSELEVSLAGRYESYSTEARSPELESLGDARHQSTYRVGFDWQVAEPWKVRGTWSTAFRLPALGQLIDRHNASFVLTVPDSSSPAGSTTALFESGNRAQLGPESARSWTLGIDLKPPGSNFDLSLTHFNIDSRDRVEYTQLTGETLGDANLSHLIFREPSQELQDAVCGRTSFAGPGDCGSAEVAAIVDLRLRNISVLKTRGFDLSSRYHFGVGRGLVLLGLDATYVTDYQIAQTPNHALLERVDTQTAPIDLRFNAVLGWSLGGFDAQAFVRYADSYEDFASATPRHVTSWTKLDTVLKYNFGFARPWLDETTLSLSVENVFDEQPPFLNNRLEAMGYDAANANLYSRRIAVTLRKAW